MNLYVPPYTELQQIPKPARVKGERWGFCGIAAMSAAIGIPPLEVHKAIPDWPGYTPSRMIVATLDGFGYDCRRVLVPRDEQRQWPLYRVTYPSQTALARIYFGVGKWADSHWFTLNWERKANDCYPLVYDNAHEVFRAGWQWTGAWEFHDEPVKLKSLYFVIRRSSVTPAAESGSRDLREFEGTICLH